MKVKVSSKSAAEQDIGNGERAMSFLIVFTLEVEEGFPFLLPAMPCSKEDFDKYKVGEKYEIK